MNTLRLTPEQFAAYQAKRARECALADGYSPATVDSMQTLGRPHNKYGNISTGRYASKREATRAAELALLQQAGKIKHLREQVPFLIIPKQDGERPCFYVADFTYTENGQEIVEDAKGHRTAEYIIKRKLLLLVHGIRVRET